MKSAIPALVIIVSVGMYFYYLNPTISEVKALSMKNEEYATVLSKMKDIAAKRDQILADYNSIPETDIAKLDKVIPDEFKSVKFANDLNNIASKYGLVVKSIRDSGANATDRSGVLEKSTAMYKTSMVSLDIQGSYPQFLKFLDDIELNLGLIDVKSLVIKYSKDDKSSIDSSSFLLEVNVYSLR